MIENHRNPVGPVAHPRNLDGSEPLVADGPRVGVAGRLPRARLAALCACGIICAMTPACTAYRTYRIWTADDPSDGYAIGSGITIPSEHRPKP
jgi:hypothetical protein